MLSERRFTTIEIARVKGFLKKDWEGKDYIAAPWAKSNCNKMVRELFLFCEQRPLRMEPTLLRMMRMERNILLDSFLLTASQLKCKRCGRRDGCVFGICSP